VLDLDQPRLSAASVARSASISSTTAKRALLADYHLAREPKRLRYAVARAATVSICSRV
jgi:hypothetical protein